MVIFHSYVHLVTKGYFPDFHTISHHCRYYCLNIISSFKSQFPTIDISDASSISYYSYELYKSPYFCGQSLLFMHTHDGSMVLVY